MNTAAQAPRPRPEVRQAVKDLLTRSAAFARLPAATQQQIARDTALLADYLVAPEGIRADRIPGGLGLPPAPAPSGALAGVPAGALAEPPQNAPEATWQERKAAVDAIGDQDFTADAAREGAKVAGLLLNQVKFPAFVSGLIEGVFHSIVKSSIEQMEAYSKMIEAVAKSLQQFRDENVTENQGRDHLAEKFPDLLEIGTDDFGDSPGPRLKLRDGVDEGDALRRINNSMTFEDGAIKSLDLSDENVEKALVINARTQLARQRQQLMASLVLMGINRIVVTDGRLSAKIMYDFQARDALSTRRSATASDYARDQYGNIQSLRTGDKTWDAGGNVSRQRGSDSSEYNADYYTKGTYKFEDKPVLTASSAASQASDSQLQTRVSLAGAVEVNFKSDYLPLDKMATPGMIAAIQGNSQPVDPNVVPSARNPEPPAGTVPVPGSVPAPPPPR